MIKSHASIRLMPVPEVFADCVIDSHMHIMSGHCSPLPLLWEQLFGVKLSQAAIDETGKMVTNKADADSLKNAHVPEGTDPLLDKDGNAVAEDKAEEVENRRALSAMRTEKIGAVAIIENAKTYELSGAIGRSPVHHDSYARIWGSDSKKDPKVFKSLFTPMITMPMDMEYGHIGGFESHGGRTVVSIENGKLCAYKRKSWHEPVDEIKRVFIAVKKLGDFQNWKKQYLGIRRIAQVHPWSILPLYHYEPRRWSYPLKDTSRSLPARAASDLSTGNWDKPFADQASRVKKGVPGLFIGFKLYPPLGYSPADFALLPHMEEFYRRCVNDKIPVVSHCSLGGIRSFEEEIYLQEEKDPAVRTRFKGKSVDYLYWRCVHPRNWRTVLERPGLANLTVCCAHFGGDLWKHGPGGAPAGTNGVAESERTWIDEIISLMKKYPNVYTDISCFNLKKNKNAFSHFLATIDQTCVDRILFGSDWYMTMLNGFGLAGIGKQYRVFCEEMKQVLDAVDPSLWVRFTLVNPCRFWGFGNTVLLENIRDHLRNNASSKGAVEDGYERMAALAVEVDRIEKQLHSFRKKNRPSGSAVQTAYA